MDRFIYNDSNNDEYYYTFQIPFKVSVINAYDKVFNRLKTYSINDIDFLHDELILINIDPRFIEDFKNYVEEKQSTLTLQEDFTNFVKEKYKKIEKFNKEFDGIYSIDEIENDSDIIDVITDKFDEQMFTDRFDLYDISYMDITDFDYKNSAFNVDLCTNFELEDDQVSMTTDYIEEQCKKYWGKRLSEEEVNGKNIFLCHGTNKKNRVSFIGMNGPDENDEDYYLEEELDY